MSSKRSSRLSSNGMSREISENAQYQTFLKELLIRATDLWDIALCHGPVLNANELLKEHRLIRERLLEIEMMQNSWAHTTIIDLTIVEERKAALEKFIAWANTVGINHRSVEVAYVEDVDGFGLASASYAAVGTDLLQVPRKAILSWDHARKSSFLKRAFNRDLIVRSMENVALALMLCCQKLVPGSHWQPYFKVLPENFNTPLFFSVEQLQYLRPSPLFEEALLLYRNVARQFIHFLLEVIRSDEFRHKKKKPKDETSKIEPIYVNSPLTAANFTFSLYRWSVACISTRINMIPSTVMKDNAGQPVLVPALIPFLDMVNHKYTEDAYQEAVHFSDETDCAEIIAVHDYKPLEPVNIFYGWRSNRDFLLHNGFVPTEQNIRDVYKLKIGLPKTKREDTRLDLFRSLGFTIESTVFAFEIKVFEPHFHVSLVQFAQIYVLDEIPATKEAAEKTMHSTDNLRKAWNFLHDRFALLHRAYGKVVDPLAEASRHDCFAPKEFYRSFDTVRKSMIARLKLSEMIILQKAEEFCSKQLSAVP